MKFALLVIAISASAATFSGNANARDVIRIVGSSTVYPFTSAVAEQFGKLSGKTPLVESTGTGGGMKLFCAGIGDAHPDVTNASRRMKKAEFEQCQKNGITDIVEIKIGFDGLTMAQSKQGIPMHLTRAQLFLALAKNVPGPAGTLIPNPYRRWSDIEKSLPNTLIEVIGPPPTSGTRDSLHELFLEPGAEQIAALRELNKADAKTFEQAWRSIREDGPYIEAGENDDVIVEKIAANRNAFGIFGYSYLEDNATKLRAVTIEGVEPTQESIASGSYKGSRALWVYVKKRHIDQMPDLKKFIAEYVSEKAIGEDGYLDKKGLVVLPKAEAETVRKAATNLQILNGAALTD